jgi:hypothetical protein
LNHLCIPTGARLQLGITFNGERSPLRYHLPETLANLKNLSHITTIYLHFDAAEKYMRLGELRVLAYLEYETIFGYTMDRRILRSLPPPILSTTQRLAVSKYKAPGPAEVGKCPVF